MAENESSVGGAAGAVTNTFNKGLFKDYNDTFVGDGMWTHARNGVNNNDEGQVGVIGNEPANLFCVDLPYTMIGYIHMDKDQWAIYTTDDTNSEIGIFDESDCTYTKVINDPCLNFKRTNLITGAYRKRFDCRRQLYWDDGLNPTRILNIDDIPYICTPVTQTVTIDFYNYLIERRAAPIPCGQGFGVNGGNQGNFTYTVGLSEEMGVVTLNFNAYDVPDRCQVIFDGVTVIDTGFRGQSSFNSALAAAGYPPVTGPGSGVWTFNKFTTTSTCTVIVTAPLSGTVWNASLSCPVRNGNTPPQPPAPSTPPRVYYNDINNAQQFVELNFGQSTTVCADPASIVETNPGEYIITRQTACGSGTFIVTPPGDCGTFNCGPLDCEALRIAPLVKQPCLRLEKGRVGGTLANGIYQVAIAYLIDGIKLTDYIGLTEAQPIWSHENTSGSLELIVEDIDRDFSEFDLVVLSNINNNTTAKRIGTYSTSQGTIYIDRIPSGDVGTVPIDQLSIRTEPIEKSDSMWPLNQYLTRVGTYSKYKFNYQIQANQIVTRWVAVEYPADYYKKGGNNTGYMRDEVYAFFIRWIYNTGYKSESYHIPGRAADAIDTTLDWSDDAYEATTTGAIMPAWKVRNTGRVESTATSTLRDGGRVIATGKMAYWQSTELYPSDRNDVWGDLCGTPIRHHKMPDETVEPFTNALNTYTQNGTYISLLGVQFSNITHPLDANGNPDPSIVGFEILRGSREGNKSIIAKGLFNNMREYTVPGNSSVKGLFQNYPYNDLNPDPFLTPQVQDGDNGQANPSSTLMGGVLKNTFSFHGPDTTFVNPYLSINEIKIYGNAYGKSQGTFELPYKHPKFRQLTDVVKIVTDILGLIDKIGIIGNILNSGGSSGKKTVFTGTETFPAQFDFAGPSEFPKWRGGGDTFGLIASTAAFAAEVLIWASQALAYGYFELEMANARKQKILDIFKALVPFRNYATQYMSHGFYNLFLPAGSGERRREITDWTYVKPSIQTFNANYTINNLYRSQYIAVGIGLDLQNPANPDNSRVTVRQSGVGVGTGTKVIRNISSHYGALKIPIPSQYGQLDSIKQMLITPCVTYTVPDLNQTFQSDVLFQGDIYINRFTEKNTFVFFNTWLLGEPDDVEFDYTKYINIPYPRYWLNTGPADNAGLLGGLGKVSSDFRSFDDKDSSLFFVKQGWFYLFNSGVRDFFVESEINVACRDWEDPVPRRFYDPGEYEDLMSMFRSDIITSGNFYKYDFSMSLSKLYTSHITWGNILPREYDPQVASTCYTYRPNQLIYSLPSDTLSSTSARADGWRMFLPFNFRDFPSKITSIKSINLTGALFMMRERSPFKFSGTETLNLQAGGTAVTIGTGTLFGSSVNPTALQSVMNTEASFEYGSNQGRWAAISTTHGLFYVSQDQGKVFQFQGGGLDEISRNGMKWWLAKYLPSQLLKRYPNYPHYDNPVIGVGTLIMYDNTHELVYITKRDYVPLKDFEMDEDGNFYTSGGTTQVVSCPQGYTLVNDQCEKDIADCCPAGFTFVDGECQQLQTVPPIPVGTTIQLTRTPFHGYGYTTRLYNTPVVGSSYTTLDGSNPFWNINFAAPQNQAAQLNNGPVNRLAIWGLQLDGSGNPFNNYNLPGTSDIPPVGQWTGFTTCITVTNTQTYHIAIAGDNRYRISIDGVIILQSDDSSLENFQALHIYPVELTAGTHTITLEGYNNQEKACFGTEIYDLNNLPGAQTPIDYLNAQTDYSSLEARVVFTTRNQTQFTSGDFTCPAGYTASTTGSCNIPGCSRVVAVQPVNCTVPPTITNIEIKDYCELTDSDCFKDASFTISYDPKIKAWLSFHDWHPTFMLPGKNHFLSIPGDSTWKHNERCDLYTNYYGVNYPFEVEFVSSTGQQVNSLRSIEYILETYKFHQDCRAKFHVLDQNFDQAIVYNSEQISGLLFLDEKSKTNPLTMLSYPQINPNFIRINFSKEENKYRFNQFWDITKDRGEFTGVTGPAMFNFEPNGYIYNVNPAYVDYNKPVLQRKKFRHHVGRVFMKKSISGDLKFLLKISNQKVQTSYR